MRTGRGRSPGSWPARRAERGSGSQTSAVTGSRRCGIFVESRPRLRGQGWRSAPGQEGGVSQEDGSPSDKSSHSCYLGDSEKS